MNDNRYRYARAPQVTDFPQLANAPSSTMFGYVPPAKGAPYGLIQQVPAPVQNGPNPGATAIPGNLAALATTPPAASQGYDSRLSPQPNPNGEKAAFTDVDFWGNIVTHHNPIYYRYNPIAQKGFDIHEQVHADKLAKDYSLPFFGRLAKNDDYISNPSSWELPAYQKQIDFYQNYLMTHPYDTPGWGNVLDAQRDVYRSLEDLEKKWGMK